MLPEDVEKIVDGVSAVSDWLWAATSGIEPRASYLANQLMRAVDSVCANVIEGFGRGTPGQLRQFYGYSYGSLLESIYWLERAIARELIDKVTGYARLHQLRLCTASLEHLIGEIRRDK